MAESTTKPTGANAYSIYVDKDTKSTQVNWAEISKNLGDTANKIAKDREAEKAAIDAATRKAVDDLNQIADTDTQSLGTLLINGSDYSKQVLMANMELMRNGGLKPKDFQLIMQQQKDGYKNLSSFVEGANDKYKIAMERLQNGEDGASIASDLEITWNEGTFGFGDLRNKRVVSNATTGELVLVTMEDDGTGQLVQPDPKLNPEAYQNVAYINQRTKFQLDRRNTNSIADDIVENLATVIDSSVGSYSAISGGGVVTSIEDFRQLFDDISKQTDANGDITNELVNDDGSAMTYEQFMSDQVDVITGGKTDLNSTNAMQVLTTAGYKMVQSEAEAKKRGIKKYIIYNNVNGRPEVQLTEAQMQEARNIAKRAIESRIDLKIKQTNPDTGQQKNQISPSGQGDIKRKEDISAYIRDINKIITNPNVATSEATMRTLVTNINEQRASADRPRVIDIDITDDIMVVKYETGEPTIVNRRIRNAAGEQTNETTLQEDIGALYQLLVPGAQSETGSLALSPSQIEKFIKEEKIVIGQRGVNRNVGYEQDLQSPETLTDQSSVLLPDETTTTTNDFWNGEDNTAEDELGKELDGGAIDSDSNIAAIANKYLEQFTTTAASKAQSKAGYSQIRVEVQGDGKNRKAVLKYSVNGTEKEIKIGTIPVGTTTRSYGQNVVAAYNKLNKEAYEESGKKGQTIRPTYPAWKLNNPQKAAKPDAYKIYQQEHPLK